MSKGSCRCGKPYAEFESLCQDCCNLRWEEIKQAGTLGLKLLAESEVKYGVKFTPSQKAETALVLGRIAHQYCRAGFMVIKDLEVGPLSVEASAAGSKTVRIYCHVDFPGKSTLAQYTFHAFIRRHGALEMNRSTFGADEKFKGRNSHCF